MTSPRPRPNALALLRAEVVESFVMAMTALAAHKLRSALTLVGVTVGVFSIILVMTVMRGLQQNIETELSGLGANTFTIEKWPAINFEGPSGWERFRRRKNLSFQHWHALREQTTRARSVAAETSFAVGELASRFERSNPDVFVNGVTPEAFLARNWIIEAGRALLPGDLGGSRNVCVMGNTIMKKLFPQGGALGETVKFSGVNYQVIGYLEPKGGFGGQAQDNFILIPITTGLNRFGGAQWRSLTLYVQTNNQDEMEDTVEQVRGVLRKVRKVPPGEADDFEISSNDSLIAQFRELTLAVRAGVAVVSSIALLAAGIGIMNIMLVSVTERTREIGVRRAIGAKKRNILTQFIMEAVVICEVGGLIGIALGVAGGNFGAYYLKLPPVFPLDWALIALGICSFVGIAFGTYPAIKAANLDPVESLRYE
ncbi:MAG: FtsX-like permease family protein [Proteobacteria bacterium]|nr:FtsX-like permease family protein [Verrucomicrobiota bacterium]NBU07482.1 FtsX-like permease family protein [Pseudomonadota bacterium]